MSGLVIPQSKLSMFLNTYCHIIFYWLTFIFSSLQITFCDHLSQQVYSKTLLEPILLSSWFHLQFFSAFSVSIIFILEPHMPCFIPLFDCRLNQSVCLHLLSGLHLQLIFFIQEFPFYNIHKLSFNMIILYPLIVVLFTSKLTLGITLMLFHSALNDFVTPIYGLWLTHIQHLNCI